VAGGSVILVLAALLGAVVGWELYRRWLRRRFIGKCLKDIPIKKVLDLRMSGAVVSFSPSLRSELKECYELPSGSIVCVTKSGEYVVVTSYAVRCTD